MVTIFAEATAPGRAGVSIVRISGPAAREGVARLAGDLPTSHQAVVRRIWNQKGEEIDQALVLAFNAPNSFTGEDVVELHLHGSVAVVRSVLAELGSQSELRLAEAGEFTRRALLNGKLDLAQVEGLADLIDAETEAQRKQALQVFSGRLGDLIEGWRADLIRAAALLEATIDFVDEDVPVDVTPEVTQLVDGLIGQIDKEIQGSIVAERVRTGFEVAIVGPPNAGKSTLLNALAGRDAAITSEIAGTTRDIVEVQMDLHGLPVTMLDTAGLRGTSDVIEQMGVDRAVSRAAAADLRVFLARPGETLFIDPAPGDITVHPMADLFPDVAGAVSGLTGKGVEELVAKITEVLTTRSAGAGVATHERHRVAMVRSKENLMRVKGWLGMGEASIDLAADELRSAVVELEVILGRVDVENLLDEIFSSFCIGK